MTISHAGAVAYQKKGGQALFLVISSSDGAHWVLPKGHIESRESPDRAAIRELKEETGVNGEIVTPLSIQKFRRRGEEMAVQYFLVRTLEVGQPDETRLLRWESEQSAFDLLTFEEARRAIREGAAKLNQA
ncbi:MAG: NUDIX domain-containing protein [Desulfobacteraceae bacterium]|nr:MAG: NUDIX domain-containing protein [Desulfobacteraceae bacterium]